VGNERGANMLDGGAPFYDTYRAVGRPLCGGRPIEQRSGRDLLRVLDLDADTLPDRANQDNWPRAEILRPDRHPHQGRVGPSWPRAPTRA